MISNLRQYAVNRILRDGGSIRIRAVRSADKDLLIEHFNRLSPRSIHFRFFSRKSFLTGTDLADLTEVDFDQRVVLVATLLEDHSEHIIGVGQYIRDPDAALRHRAMVAFAVIDAHQGRGVGTLLLEQLVLLARGSGIAEFEADVLGENNRMMRVFAKSGFQVARSMEFGVFHLLFPTEENQKSIQVSHEREKFASTQSMKAFLSPRSVAVIGASRSPGKLGGILISNMIEAGYAGKIYPVNPQAKEIAGLTTYPSITSIGEPIDLAIIGIESAGVEEVILDCAKAGVRGVIVISSGFANPSEDPREVQRRLTDLTRSAGMRLAGPRCLGVLNTDPEVRLNATFAPVRPLSGNVGFLTQSEDLGLVLYHHAHRLGVGVSSFVSIGNMADVSCEDLLAYWAEDAHTEVIVLYLESFGDPNKFSWLAQEVAARKPIVAVKSGRSATGARAASSHSAALASLDIAVDALFEQAGVIRTDTLEELFGVVSLLSTQPVMKGPRVGVVGNAGGLGVLMADGCAAKGLQLPELSSSSIEAINNFLPASLSYGRSSNPLDMSPRATGDHYERAMAAMGDDPEIDAVVAIHVPPALSNSNLIAAGIARGAAQLPALKPCIVVFSSSEPPPDSLHAGPRGNLPTFNFPETAALALSASHRYAKWRSRPRGEVFSFDAFTRTAIRAVIDRVLEQNPGPLWVDPKDMMTVLRAAGIEFAHAEVSTPAQAAVVARQMEYPLVVKAAVPELLHKSEIGGVILGIESEEELISAVELLEERVAAHGYTLQTLLIQRQIAAGMEALVGVTSDPTFGHLVVCGLGGIMVELLKDVAFHLHPVSDHDAGEMIDKLRSRALLDGYRGFPPADRDAFIHVIRRVSALIEVIPELREMDLNPVKLLQPGEGAIAVDGRMRIARR